MVILNAILQLRKRKKLSTKRSLRRFLQNYLEIQKKVVIFTATKSNNMNSTSLSVTDVYGQWLSSLSVSDKLDIISLLTESLRSKKSKSNEVDIDAIFEGFNKDWGGEGTPEEIAASLRKKSLETRVVEVW